jgi:hypothetical protein
MWSKAEYVPSVRQNAEEARKRTWSMLLEDLATSPAVTAAAAAASVAADARGVEDSVEMKTNRFAPGRTEFVAVEVRIIQREKSPYECCKVIFLLSPGNGNDGHLLMKTALVVIDDEGRDVVTCMYDIWRAILRWKSSLVFFNYTHVTRQSELQISKQVDMEYVSRISSETP